MDTTAEKQKKFSFRAALLSLSLLTIMSGAGVAPGIHTIAEAFPGTPETVIKLIISLPPLFMIITALLSGMLGQYIKHRILIGSGLVLFIIGGVGAGYMHSIPYILLFRAILGFGTGIILPFSTGLIAACYLGDDRSRMMGYSSAANCTGAVIGNILAGVLAVISWKYMFSIYWLGAFVLLLTVFFLKPLPDAGHETANKEKLPSGVFLYSFFAFLTMMIFFLIVTNLSFFVDARDLGSSWITGFLFAANSLTMLVAGVLLQCMTRLKRYFVPLVLILISAGIFGIAKAPSLSPMFLSVIVAGFGLGLLFPFLLNSISKNVPKYLSVKAMSVGMASAWLGQFVSPVVFGGIAAAYGLSMTSVFFYISVIILAVAAGYLLFNVINKKR